MTSLEDVGASHTTRRNLLTDRSAGQPVVLAEISASAFWITGVEPALGCWLDADDEADAAPLVVVLGHDVWRSCFAADPRVIGEDVRLGSEPATLVGIMPEGFVFPMLHEA